MVSPSKDPRAQLSPLNTSWHNSSMSSISAASETATFHSAHAHLSNMELRPLSQPTPVSTIYPLPTIVPMPSPKLEAIKMDRQDSGYSETLQSPSSSRRTSTSSRQHSPHKAKRRTTNSSQTSNSRSSTKRTSRSSAQIRTSNSGVRPLLSTRHTTSYSQPSSHTTSQQPYQFFQFPTLSDPPPPPPPTSLPDPPPTTIQYWTSDSTRRLEYAAIDAASKGVKGFFIKIVPDCILPINARRTKFHNGNGDADSDCGSVRRYRLVLPEDKGCASSAVGCERGEMDGKRPTGLLRRWTSFGRRKASMS